VKDQIHYIAAAPFEAACRIPLLPAAHPSHALHGHSYSARVRTRTGALPGAFSGGECDALASALQRAVAPLDYADLNRHLDNPTDENLARWLLGRLADGRFAGSGGVIDTVGIQSTANEGVDLDARDHAHIWRRFRFEAAHRLPNVPAGHQCGRMHGHGFEVILHADQDLDGSDMGIDLDHLASCWEPLQQQLHYACMNDIPGLENPTSEMLARWIWRQLKPVVAELSWVTVYETATAGCHYDGEHFRIWKDLRFESALRLSRGPASDIRRRLHGHSYLLRLHLSAPLDEVMGWTVDYGEVKALFTPLYKELDHHRLDELDGLADPGVARLVYWLQQRCVGLLPQMDRIDLLQTPGCGALLSWGGRGPALPL